MTNPNGNSHVYDVNESLPPSIANDDRFNTLDIDSLYCDVDNIKESLPTCSNSNYCTLHVNIHSQPSKFEQLKDVIYQLSEFGVHVHFILLCETFLVAANATSYQMPGYNLDI